MLAPLAPLAPAIPFFLGFPQPPPPPPPPVFVLHLPSQAPRIIQRLLSRSTRFQSQERTGGEVPVAGTWAMRRLSPWIPLFRGARAPTRTALRRRQHGGLGSGSRHGVGCRLVGVTSPGSPPWPATMSTRYE